MSSFFGRMSSRTPAAAATNAKGDMSRPPLARSQSADSRSSAEEPRSLDGAAARASALRRHQRQLRGDGSEPSTAGSGVTSGGAREKRKPIVVRYDMASESTGPAAASRAGLIDPESDDGGALSDDAFAPFDVESAMAGYAASFSPSSKRGGRGRQTTKFGDAAAPAGPTRARSQTRSRLAMSLSRSQRAELKAQKYDVEWRADRDCACCQVCYAMFTKLSRRRHHCRVCGDLVCGDCSGDQVLLVGRFDAPKRACVACVTLLQTMQHSGDARVSIDGSKPMASSSGAAAASQQPLATPRYHDRLGEVHRVMAAGKKSERRGSTQSEMYVISSAWLRRWLAFTRAASDDAPYSSTNHHHHTSDSADAFANSGTSTVFSSPSNSLVHAAPPGPIDNVALLELRKGKLVKRPELVRDDCVEPSGSPRRDGAAADGYQFISTEVWEVLQRLYGGGPGIRVTSDDNFTHWLVDVGALLAAAAGKVQVAPTVERVLVTRHDAGGYEVGNGLSQTAGGSCRNGAMTPTPLSASAHTGGDGAAAFDKSPAAGVGAERGSFGARGSLHQARVRPNSPQSSAACNSSGIGKAGSQTYPDFARASTKAGDAFDDLRDSKAATAASAFALAMKQARLNAQKALEDRSRVTQHAEAA
ncbi:hypothetical protein PybrP1_012836 [[Pythium] brassicae (nom. inval.)]|nr:hypothetical protein PybrP1_012836 [[Pythium] brassicae (nom. inval.)]